MSIKTENDEKKEYLRGYQRECRRLERYMEQYEEIVERKTGISQKGDGMPRGTNQTDLSEYAAQVDDIERKIKMQENLCERKMNEITEKIEKLTKENEKNVLTYRYIRRMNWDEVCRKMQYSWRQIHRIHANALKNFKMA